MKIEKRLTEIEPPRILNQSETWSEIVNGSVESLQSESELQGRHHFETLQSALGLQGRLGSLRPELELQGQFETRGQAIPQVEWVLRGQSGSRPSSVLQLESVLRDQFASHQLESWPQDLLDSHLKSHFEFVSGPRGRFPLRCHYWEASAP